MMLQENTFDIEEDIDCINWGPILEYLDEKGVDSSPIIELAGMPREKLTKTGNMISLRKALQLMNSVKDILKQPDPRIFYFIGRESTRLGSYGMLLDMARKLGNTEKSVRFVPRFNRKFNDMLEMPVYNVTKNSGIVVVHYKKKEGYNNQWIFDQDHWSEGILAGIPLAWDLPYMETNTVLSRFSIEDIFRDYGYMGHKLEKKGHVYLINGVEMAQEVVLETEELERSLDMLDTMKGGFIKKPEIHTIVTNKGAIELYKVSKNDREHLPKGVIFTRDFQIGELYTIKEGTVFGSEYSRINLKWEPKKKLKTKVYEVILGNRKTSKKIIGALEEELTVSKEKTYEIERLLRTERQLTAELQEHKEHLEEKVEQRTTQYKKQKDIAIQALTEKEKAENLAIQQEKMAAMGRLLYDLSHAFKNPMVSVTEAQELLKKGLEKRDTLYELLETTKLKKAHIQLLLKQRNKIKENALTTGTPTTIERLKAKKALDELTEKYSIQFEDDLKDRMLRFDIQGKSYKSLTAILKQFPENKELIIDYLENEYNITINLRDLGTASNSLKASIGSILSLARKDMKPSAFSIHQGLDDILHLTSAEYKHIVFNKEYQSNLPKVVGYQSQINDVLRNIIINSIEALKGEGEISITTAEQDEYVQVIISDNGPGIPENIQDKVLNPFFTTKEYGKGTGLGLSLSYEIISKNHDGELTFDSKPGATNFYLKLPTEKP